MDSQVIKDQLSQIDNLKKEWEMIQNRKKELLKCLDAETKQLQSLCEATGHHFDRHGGWDGHRNEYYYVCNVCQYSTPYRQENWEKDYSY